MLRALFFVALLLVRLLYTLPEEAPTIRPEQLLVATVIDVTSSEIVRDAINLLKSIRIFGGSFNQATILVGVIGQTNKAFPDEELLATLVALQAEIHFLSPVTGKAAKTLNKFKAFDVFDSTKYDYFLWLDADIVLFQDPMSYLHMHKYPGEIGCVPDFYSYMRRFPSVNQSSEYWNPALPTSYLLGEGEVAPNGICNTGVLYFDSLSLSTFKEGLHNVLSNDSFMLLHGKDRFVDSLIFTKVVNELAMEVSIMPYSMNYMALFEIELQEEIFLTDIVFAHFVSDTELYCNNNVVYSDPTDRSSTRNECSCVYRNKLLPPKHSLLRDTVEQHILSNETICLTFAGLHMPARVAGTRHRQAVEVPKAETQTALWAFESLRESDGNIVTDEVFCNQVIPPAGSEWFIHSSCAQAPVQLDVAIECVYIAARGFEERPLQVRSTILSRPGGAIVSENSLDVVPRCRDGTCTASSVFTIALDTTRTQAKTAFALNTMVNVASGTGEERSTKMESKFTVVQNELVPPGQVHYSNNLLLTTKSMAIESQLLLPEFLNSRLLRGTGVAVCCGTHKGVATVKRLVEKWRGEHLMVIVESTPEGDRRSVQQLATELEAHCDAQKAAGSQLICVIATPPQNPLLRSVLPLNVPFNRRVSTAMRSGSASFVFTDVRGAYDELREGLQDWSRVLGKYGVLMGTQYGAQPWSNAVTVSTDGVTETTRLVAEQVGVRFAVNYLSEQLNQHALLTYLERDLEYCAAFTGLYKGPASVVQAQHADCSRSIRLECSPAWYFVKQR